MAVEARVDRSPEPRTVAARKAYPDLKEEDSPLDLTTHSRKEISVRDFARHSFADPTDYVRAQVILRQSRDYLAAGRDSGTESDDSAGRLSPGDDTLPGKAYKKSLMKRYSKIFLIISVAKRLARLGCCAIFKLTYHNLLPKASVDISIIYTR